MKAIIVFAALVSVAAFASSPKSRKPTSVKSPVTSKEEVQFISKGEDEVHFFGKVQGFVGIFERTFEKNPDLQVVELYTFPTVQVTKMDPAVCQQMVEKIFNPKQQEYLKIQPPNFRVLSMGKVCEVSVHDVSSWAKFKEKHLIAGFLKGKPYALLFKIEKNSTTQSDENARNFWDGLR